MHGSGSQDGQRGREPADVEQRRAVQVNIAAAVAHRQQLGQCLHHNEVLVRSVTPAAVYPMIMYSLLVTLLCKCMSLPLQPRRTTRRQEDALCGRQDGYWPMVMGIQRVKSRVKSAWDVPGSGRMRALAVCPWRRPSCLT